jgi:LacI family transcriptional regulator
MSSVHAPRGAADGAAPVTGAFIDRRVTLRDVAAAAGVSVATVSRALNDDPQISVATRERVTATAEVLGYLPDLAARSLAVRASRTFGLMVPDATDPIHGTVVAGFETAAQAAGYTVIVANSLGDASRERRAIREFAAHRADGLALMGCVLDHEAIAAMVRPSPVVFLNSERLSHGRLTILPQGCLRPDEPEGIRLLVEHLVGQGCRRIAYVGADRGASNAIRSAAVGAEVAARLGTEPVASVSWRPERRVDLAVTLRAAGADAVIGYDDRVALSLLDGFRSIGMSVPRDVAVAGFDDIPFAEISNPRLTTVAQPASEMGELAVDELVAAIATGSLSPSRVLPVRLVVRESTVRAPT